MVVAITGGTGFLGSYIVEELLKNDHTVIVLKRTTSDIWRLKNIQKQITFYDIDSPENINLFFSQHKVDCIIHTATNYGRNEKYFSELVNANLFLPLRILEASLKNSVPVFINTDTFISRENVKVDYLSSYQLSKRQFFEWAELYCKDIKFINFRLEHPYGPKDNDSKFVVQIIKSLLKNETINATKGEQKRDFIYVSDAAKAFSFTLSNINSFPKGVQDIELGTGTSISIKDFINMAHSQSMSESKLSFGALPYRNNEIMDSTADINKLLAIGWKPDITIESGIQKIIDYEKERLL